MKFCCTQPAWPCSRRRACACGVVDVRGVEERHLRWRRRGSDRHRSAALSVAPLSDAALAAAHAGTRRKAHPGLCGHDTLLIFSRSPVNYEGAPCASASRSRGHENRSHRARLDDRARAPAAADGDAARRLRRERSTRFVAARSSARRAREASRRSGHRSAWGFPARFRRRYRRHQELELHVDERPAAWRRPAATLLGRPMRFENDANCFALLGSHRRRCKAGAAIVFGVIVGTGTGGGIVIERQRPERARTQSPASGSQQSAASAERRRAAGADVLLRPPRVHRDVSVRAGTVARGRPRTAGPRW